MKNYLNTHFISFIKESIKRFPGSLLFALIASMGIVMCTAGTEDNEEVSLLLVSMLGFIYSTVIHTANHHNIISRKWMTVLLIVLSIILTGYGYYNYRLMEQLNNYSVCEGADVIAWGIIGMILLGVVPFIYNYGRKRFSLYHQSMLFHFLKSVSLSLVLYISLALVLSAIDNLLGINVVGDIYAYLFAIVFAAFFAPTFLSGIPMKIELNELHFSSIATFILKYLLIPTVTVYAVILILYAIKTILGGFENYDEEAVWIILWFYTVSFIAYALNIAKKEEEDNIYSRRFVYYFERIMIPIAALSIYGSYMVMKYNFNTINYFILAFSVWLILYCGVVTLKKNVDFRYVSGSFILLIFITHFTPFSFCNVGTKMTLSSLKDRLIEHNVLTNNGFNTDHNLTSSHDNEVYNQIRLLRDYNQLDKIKEWDKSGLLADGDDLFQSLTYFIYNREKPIDDQQTFTNDLQWSLDISEYQFVTPIQRNFSDLKEVQGLSVILDNRSKSFRVHDDGEFMSKISYQPIIEVGSLNEHKYFIVEDATYKLLIVFEFISIEGSIITNIDGKVFIKIK